ncbi:MAG: transposase [Treponema sp.]|jgi:putative transposase|nr:transposase [Treponema sp.]
MRKPREREDNVIYDVSSEINRGAADLQSPEMKTKFLVFVKKAQQKYSFELLNFCITDNYIHLIIKPASGQSISRIMQWIKGNFAKYWNKEHNTKGHLWGERFFSKIIRNVSQFWDSIKYIDERPVEAKLAAKAEDWEFCGLYHDARGRLDVVAIPRIVMPWLFFGIA